MAYVTTHEAGRMLGVAVRTVQLWAESGRLECWKTEGGHRRISRESVMRLLADPAGEAPRTPPPSPQPGGEARALRVMVVEDDPSLLRLFRLQLSRWSLRPEVHTAANGYEALLRIGNLTPDLLITDLNMPEIDGFQMLRAIRGMPQLDSMEIIVVTGLDDAGIAAHGELPPEIPILRKPVSFAELERMAMRVADRSSQRSGK
jgi:excisionase family DNA binding protein